jgi:uncharacterized membrane protein YdjX (TVP38/TMEM64 family)/rhodanese-related sulfurtransferase
MRRLKRVVPRIALSVLLATAIAWAIANRQRFDSAAILEGLAGLGDWAPLAYVGLYIVATIVFLPGSILGLAGGALFGPLWGTVYTLIGATTGATLAFLVARYVASDWVAARAGGRMKQLVEGVEGEGWRFVAFVRLVPLFPFNLLNYALGLTRIRLLEYMLASFVCMMPGTIAYTYLGYAGREAFTGGESIVRKGVIALALLASAAFLPRLVRRFRQQPGASRHVASDVSWIEAPELMDRLMRGPAPIVLDVRGPDEFTGELGHIAGALNIPLADLQHRVGEIDQFKTGSIVLVCKTQMRSAKAAALLEEAGFRDVSVLHGGMVEWRRRERPVDRD